MKIAKQAIRHLITGGVADLADLAFFGLLFFIFRQDIISKTLSFFLAVAIKYAGNKYWAFSAQGGPASGWEKPHRKEIILFSLVTLIGLMINVASFYLFSKINAGVDQDLWRQISVIFAMGTTAIWNFLTYKFIVFKK